MDCAVVDRVRPRCTLIPEVFLDFVQGTTLAMGCRMRSMSAVDPRVSFAELETFDDYGGLLSSTSCTKAR